MELSQVSTYLLVSSFLKNKVMHIHHCGAVEQFFSCARSSVPTSPALSFSLLTEVLHVNCFRDNAICALCLFCENSNFAFPAEKPI